MPLMKAVQVDSPRAEFELVDKEIPDAQENQVLIRVEACGVCHGEALVKEGHYPGLQYPRVPGHEVVGRIVQVGSNAAPWEVGQRVGVGWYGGPCGRCSACKRGDPSSCQNPLTTGISFDGGYAEYMAAPTQALTFIPAELDSLEAAPLLCAGRIAFTALRNSGARAGDMVAILGLGGLGHLAVQFARKFGFKTVALSRGKEKEALAYELGAHVFIDTEAANPGDELAKVGGARVILAACPSGQAVMQVLNGLGFEGELILLATQSEPIQISPIQLARGGRTIRGWVGRRARNPAEDALDFSVLSGVRPRIEVFPLEQATLAFEKMMNAKVHFRAVLETRGH